jgi:hypothetical protein
MAMVMIKSHWPLEPGHPVSPGRPGRRPGLGGVGSPSSVENQVDSGKLKILLILDSSGTASKIDRLARQSEAEDYNTVA